MKDNSFPLFFKPHVGAKYFTTGYNGHKILILGHTYPCNEKGIHLDADHTCMDCNNPNKSNGICSKVVPDFIKQHLNGKLEPNNNKTFTSMEKVILKEKYCIDEVANFWDSVIFSEYVQTAVLARVGETYPNYYKASVDSFIEILQNYMPEYILTWGHLVFDKAVYSLREKGIVVKNANCEINGYSFIFAKIIINGRELKMLRMHHPCQGFGSEEWKQKIDKFFEL